MAWGNVVIKKAADDSDGNEQFYLVQFDPLVVQPVHPGHVKETKGPLREAVIRDFLATFGHPPAVIDEMFRIARARGTR
jgi:hypothetical protein